MNKIFAIILGLFVLSETAIRGAESEAMDVSTDEVLPNEHRYQGLVISFIDNLDLKAFKQEAKDIADLALIASNNVHPNYYAIVGFKNNLSEDEITDILDLIDIEELSYKYIDIVYDENLNRVFLFNSDSGRRDLFNI